MKIILKDHRIISWNKVYAGMHWSQRRYVVEGIHQVVQTELYRMGFKQTTKPHFTRKVNIRIDCYFNQRPLDSDNIVAKILIDPLKGILIKDDSIAYVGDVTTRSEIDRQNPRIEIMLE